MTAPLTIDDRTIRARKFASQIIAIIRDCVSDKVGAESRLIDAAYQADIEIVRATGAPAQEVGHCGKNDARCDYFEMLWKWFESEERCGAEYMRAEMPEGLSADDFKIMLDEHEQSLLAASPAKSSWQPPEGFVMVPQAAIKWLHGEGPDDAGKWFGDAVPEIKPGKPIAHYWWRSVFRRMCSVPSTEPSPPDWKQDQAETSRLAPRVSSTQRLTPSDHDGGANGHAGTAVESNPLHDRQNDIERAKVLLREKPSTSYLQRKMQITYNKASSIITALEEEGFISSSDSAGRRTVLVPSTQRDGAA